MLNLQSLTAASFRQADELVRKMMADDTLSKASVDLATNLTGFNLEAPAKLLVPLLSPFRQSIGRQTIGGKATNWKRITAVSPTSGFFPAEGVKANKFTLTLSDVAATFRSFGRAGDVTWEANIAGRNYEDARARAETLLLLQVLMEEELIILGGNRTALNSGTGPTVTATATAGGSLADDEYFVKVCALTMEGVARASHINRPLTGQAANQNRYDLAADGIPTLDTSVGCTAAGTEDSATTATSNNSLTCTWGAVSGAVAYAVYVGLTTDINKLVAITTQTEMIIDTLPALTGADEPTVDTSANTLAFDGIIAQLLAAGSGAYVKNLNAPLSAAVGHGIPEISDAIQRIYDRTKVEPDRIVCGWQEADNIDNKLAAVANDRVNIVYDGSTAGGPRFEKFKFVSSPVTGKQIPIESNPNVPGGVMLFLIDGVPYQNSEIPAAWQMHMGSDLTRLDYAMTAPQDEFEIRAFGVLAGYAPGLQGIIYNIHRF